MANTHDIREWGKERGYEVSDTGPLSAELRQAYQAYETGAESDASAKVQSPERQETAPKERSTPVTRAREAIAGARSGAQKSSRTRKATAKKTFPRVSVEDILGTVWSGIGSLMSRPSPPVGYMMKLEAPVAGLILEDVVKGTVVDRVLQPVARNGDRAKSLGALVGPPFLVLTLQFRPDLAPDILPQLRRMMATWIDVAGPKIEIVAEREAKFEEKYGESIDQMMEGLVSYFEQPTEASSDGN